MMQKNKIDQINHMTFAELRNELANSTDPVRKEIIRNLMYIRYKQHMDKKERIHQLKRENKKKQLKKIKQKIEEKYKAKPVTNKEDYGDILNANDFVLDIKEENPVEKFIGMPKYNDTELPEYDRDRSNNSLMQRMSNDIDIKKIKEDIIYKPKKESNYSKDFSSPSSNNLDDQYASFNDAFKPLSKR